MIQIESIQNKSLNQFLIEASAGMMKQFRMCSESFVQNSCVYVLLA